MKHIFASIALLLPFAAAAGQKIPDEHKIAGFALGCQAYTFNRFTVFEAIEKTDQAGGKVRSFAEDGKTRASDVLEELSRVVADTADSIDERLGNNYGEYARKAADSVSSLADNLRSRDVDELYDNVRSAVRKSPGVAIGIAAVVGFTLVRLIKAGLPEENEGGNGGSGGRTRGGGTGA